MLQLARLLHMDILENAAQSAVVSLDWTAPIAEQLLAIMESQTHVQMKEMLHSPQSSLISELQVSMLQKSCTTPHVQSA